MNNSQISRRSFLKQGALASGGLLMGVALPATQGVAMAAGTATVSAPNAWVHIGDDNSITILSARSEMGQGVYTSMPMLIAEELNVDMHQIKVVDAPVNPVFVNSLLGAQITGGSTSVRDGWEKLRVAGAQVREMLVAAAATQWGVKPEQVKAAHGHLVGPHGHKTTYGAVAAAAAKLPIPKNPAIKDPKHFRIVGKAVPRVDTPAKVNGTAEFGIDVRLPGMVYATVKQCPVIGGKVKSLDDSAAKAMPGVLNVVKIGDGTAVAVVANSWWRAKKAADALNISWDDGAVAKLSDASIIDSTRDAIKTVAPMAIGKPVGDVAAAMKSAAKVMSAEYITPLQSHSPLEPMNFTAHVDGDKALVIGPTQFQQGAAGAVAAATGIPAANVTVRTTYLGGGFGRRIELDFISQAAEISKAVGKPVKLLWTREEDMTHDFYRPIGVNQIEAGVDASGKPVAVHFKVASQSITQRAFGLAKNMVDPFMTEYAVPNYQVPNQQHDLIIYDSGFRVGYWRSVSHNMNAFANESFIDELAHNAGQDPVAYRMSLLAPGSRPAKVLKLAAQKAGWGKKLPKGHAHGVALMEGYGTHMAEIAEISLNQDGSVRVHKVTVVCDCGHMVNPDTVQAQIQSGIVFGLGAAIKQQITLKDGVVQQSNFNTYDPVRLNETPRFDITLVKSEEKPGGIGEPATALIGPAVANAVAVLTGKRLRRLPITAEALQKV